MDQYTVLVTNCVSQKARTSQLLSLPENQSWRDLNDVGRFWRECIRRSESECTFRDLYIGSAPAVAKRASRSSGAELMFVSCGYGLVAADEEGTSYDLTVSDRTNALAVALSKLGLKPADWWDWVTNNGFGYGKLSTFLAEHPNAIMLLALPSSYLELVRRDLEKIAPPDLERLRVFSSAQGIATLPEKIKPLVMPYDERLSGIPGYDGPRVNFSQRAAAHFIEVLDGQHLSLNFAKKTVSGSLSGLKLKPRIQRPKVSDELILEKINEHWDALGGRTGKLLRFVRDELRLAVEQSRFAGLCRRVRTERE